jgi:hypothetical protein
MVCYRQGVWKFRILVSISVLKYIKDIFAHHTTLHALQLSARGGCHLCPLLHAESTEHTNMSDGLIAYHLSIGNLRSDTIHVMIHKAVKESRYISCRVIKQDFRLSTLRISNTSAPEIVELAQHWLIQCVKEEKEACGTSSKFLTWRLIKLTGVYGEMQPCHLVLRQELAENTQNLTLSHCWGNVQLAVLSRNIYEACCSDIPPSNLPKTFQDAFQVTLWLGHWYIWIDSLCIQQDSESDWVEEEVVMGEIYRNSTCTIGATGLRNSNKGLFFVRLSLEFTPCLLLEWQDGVVFDAERISK